MSDIANLREENRTLKDELVTLRKRVVDSLDQSTKVTTIDSEVKLFREIQECTEKSKNILIFGVNEDNDKDENPPITVKTVCLNQTTFLQYRKEYSKSWPISVLF
jgi:hypothetical protein